MTVKADLTGIGINAKPGDPPHLVDQEKIRTDDEAAECQAPRRRLRRADPRTTRARYS